jgi:hypothetical protein
MAENTMPNASAKQRKRMLELIPIIREADEKEYQAMRASELSDDWTAYDAAHEAAQALTHELREIARYIPITA